MAADRPAPATDAGRLRTASATARTAAAEAGPVLLEGAGATRAFGARLGRLLHGGDVVVLVGDLGAGKTTLVQGLAVALGTGPATSPTFTLVNEYTTPDGLRLVHADAYRLGVLEVGELEIDTLGLDEWLGADDAVVVIEWGERLLSLLPADLLLLTLAHADDEQARNLRMTAFGPRSAELLRALAAWRSGAVAQ
jgi:tRNA threonylcarbamoyladenosine biosynthesis protein TsaE